MTAAPTMTAGDAMFRAACESLGLDPDARGSATRLHGHVADLCTLGQLSEWRRGRYAPRPETVAAFEQRFKFKLSQSWTWAALATSEAAPR